MKSLTQATVDSHETRFANSANSCFDNVSGKFSDTLQSILVLSAIAIIATSVGTSSSACAQSLAEIAESAGLTQEKGSIPFWKEPDIRTLRALTGSVIDSEKSIMLVGHPKEGFGTAFVISQKHRLLATNAHVADILSEAGSMYAIENGSSKRRKVVRAWYHPAVRRIVSKSSLITSADPKFGPVSPTSRDVAVLQLEDDGTEISKEMKLATLEEIEHAFAQPIGMMGFPGHDTQSWPEGSDAANATFHQGVISRITDFNFTSAGSWKELQFVQHTTASWNGFSGSPIFLPNGHIVAIHNMSRTASRSSETRTIAHGVRIDCLWELLVYHNLNEEVSLSEDRRKFVNLSKYEQILESELNLRKAVSLIEQVDANGIQQSFSKGAELCNEAIGLAPDFPPIFMVRCEVYHNYAAQLYQKSGSSQDVRRYIEYANNDAEKYAQLAPSDPRSLIALAAMYKAKGAISRSSKLKRKALEILNALLTSSNSKEVRSEALVIRGGLSGEFYGADSYLEDMNRAISTAVSKSQEINAYLARATYWEESGNPTRAREDRQKAKELY